MIKKEPEIAFKPTAAQSLAMSAPVWETLLTGDRGGGKTAVLLGCYLQHVGKGYGSDYRGLILKREAKYLTDIKLAAQKLIPKVFPTAVYNISTSTWTFEDGELLYLRHCNDIKDYYNLHGSNISQLYFDELSTWPTSDVYDMCKSLVRSATAGVPLRIIATTNACGVGKAWLKKYFIDPVPFGQINRPEGDTEGVATRVAIEILFRDNLAMQEVDPHYHTRLAQGLSPDKVAAWIHHDWDYVSTDGMFFDGFYDKKYNEIPQIKFHEGMEVYRGFDWGSSAPSAVLWYVVCNGEDVELTTGEYLMTVPGDIIVFFEYCTATLEEPNKGNRMLASDLAKIIKSIDDALPVTVRPGVADTAIYKKENGMCIADDMSEEGVDWLPANKKKGSRVAGWELMKGMFSRAQTRFGPAIYFVDTCRFCITTIPTLAIDKINPEDVDTKGVDHMADALRYNVTYQSGLRDENNSGFSNTTDGGNYL